MKSVSSLLACLICLQLFACNANEIAEQKYNSNTSNTDTTKMKITIGSAVFTATLKNHATTSAFKAMLPLTLNMSELNGNEKFYYFSTALPTHATTGGSIQGGDIMLYGNNCLVLFYKSLTTSYSYTRLGRIDNPAGLIAALGSGSITVKFENN